MPIASGSQTVANSSSSKNIQLKDKVIKTVPSKPTIIRTSHITASSSCRKKPTSCKQRPLAEKVVDARLQLKPSQTSPIEPPFERSFRKTPNSNLFQASGYCEDFVFPSPPSGEFKVISDSSKGAFTSFKQHKGGLRDVKQGNCCGGDICVPETPPSVHNDSMSFTDPLLSNEENPSCVVREMTIPPWRPPATCRHVSYDSSPTATSSGNPFLKASQPTTNVLNSPRKVTYSESTASSVDTPDAQEEERKKHTIIKLNTAKGTTVVVENVNFYGFTSVWLT